MNKINHIALKGSKTRNTCVTLLCICLHIKQYILFLEYPKILHPLEISLLGLQGTLYSIYLQTFWWDRMQENLLQNLKHHNNLLSLRLSRSTYHVWFGNLQLFLDTTKVLQLSSSTFRIQTINWIWSFLSSQGIRRSPLKFLVIEFLPQPIHLLLNTLYLQFLTCCKGETLLEKRQLSFVVFVAIIRIN